MCASDRNSAADARDMENKVKNLSGKWEPTGKFGDDYSKVPGATVPYHLGIDEIYVLNDKNATIGSVIRAPDDMKITEIGKTDALGNFVRGTTTDGARIDIFHNNKITISIDKTVKKGDIIAVGGDTGIGNAHAHTAKSYPDKTSPSTAGKVIKAFGRDYVTPPTQADAAW